MRILLWEKEEVQEKKMLLLDTYAYPGAKCVVIISLIVVIINLIVGSNN